jgi:hypothetical protein
VTDHTGVDTHSGGRRHGARPGGILGGSCPESPHGPDVNVAARGCGVARRAFELGVSYAQQRETFGQKIVDHQAVLLRLADMAVKVEAGHEMMVKAARRKDSGQRNDLEAGMAKYLASQYSSQVVEDSFRITTPATATPRSTRSSGSTARPRCCSSARARPTSSG